MIQCIPLLIGLNVHNKSAQMNHSLYSSVPFLISWIFLLPLAAGVHSRCHTLHFANAGWNLMHVFRPYCALKNIAFIKTDEIVLFESVSFCLVVYIMNHSCGQLLNLSVCCLYVVWHACLFHCRTHYSITASIMC